MPQTTVAPVTTHKGHTDVHTEEVSQSSERMTGLPVNGNMESTQKQTGKEGFLMWHSTSAQNLQRKKQFTHEIMHLP